MLVILTFFYYNEGRVLIIFVRFKTLVIFSRITVLIRHCVVFREEEEEEERGGGGVCDLQ